MFAVGRNSVGCPVSRAVWPKVSKILRLGPTRCSHRDFRKAADQPDGPPASFASGKLPFVTSHSRPSAAGRGYISMPEGGTGLNPLEWPVHGGELVPHLGSTRPGGDVRSGSKRGDPNVGRLQLPVVGDAIPVAGQLENEPGVPLATIGHRTRAIPSHSRFMFRFHSRLERPRHTAQSEHISFRLETARSPAEALV